jgi:DNA-binding MarR family transcriptional regulator
MKIGEEIQQKEFKNEFIKAHINILFSSSWFHQTLFQCLKPYNISLQQFNILRILRGRYPENASMKELASKMIDKMSNASRLVDKLEKKNLVNRFQNKVDRRKVDVTITELGLKMLEEVSRVLESAITNSMQNISEEEAKLLNNILDKMRG